MNLAYDSQLSIATTAKRDLDEITVANFIFDEIVKLTETEPVEDTPNQAKAIRAAAARASNLTDTQISAIARKAATVLWARK